MKTTKRLLKKIKKSTPIYMIGFWAKWGVRKYEWTGKWYYEKDTGIAVPIVWHYYDGNGTCDDWIKLRLDLTTCGIMYDWTFRKEVAERTAEMLNNANIGLKSKTKSNLPTTGSCAVSPKNTITIKYE